MRATTKLYRIFYTYFGNRSRLDRYMIVEATSVASAMQVFYRRKRPVMKAGQETGYLLEHIEEVAE